MSRQVRLITYNINGIRAALRKDLLKWIQATEVDILCLQEVKALRSEIPVVAFEELGYSCYFAPAERKGYSGVAIFSRVPVLGHAIGCAISSSDKEGRLIQIDIEGLSILSVYMPSGSSGDQRQSFKMQWLSDFAEYIHQLRKRCPHLIISGDFNICHQSIDIHDPIRNKNSSGFLPEERNWMSNFLDTGFTDVFRFFCPDPHHYTWWSYRSKARDRNLGWRIDYHLATHSLKNRLQRSQILTQAHHSDHCPVLLDIE